MVARVIDGGQAGEGQARWRAARAVGIATGGRMAAGFLTEIGPRPQFADLYGAAELAGGGDPERTRANARDSDATVWFGDSGSPGGRTTLRACGELGRPVFEVIERRSRPSDLAAWIGAEGVQVLNVAGNRGSTDLVIGDQVERFLVAAFARLAGG